MAFTPGPVHAKLYAPAGFNARVMEPSADTHDVGSTVVGVITTLSFTITVAVYDAPGQLLDVGMIVKVTVTGPLVVFVSAPEISPVPFDAIPVTLAVLSLVQV